MTSSRVEAGLGAPVTPHDEPAPSAGETVRPARRHDLGGRGGGRWQHLIIATIALLGLALMLYPGIAQWLSALNERTTIFSHAQTLDRFDSDEIDAALAAAEHYNTQLRSGLIIDPFSNTSPEGTPALDAAARRYLAQLALDPNGTMARVQIPGAGIDLPIAHGATEDVLRKGAGHLYGSSLPVGGPSTHAVITAHSGLPEAKLFDRIPEVKLGQTFRITTYGRSMTYRVTAIETALPTELQNLTVVPGKDLVTLVTCTPYGINTHRLLVHGERVADPTPDRDDGADLLLGMRPPWEIIFLGAAVTGWSFLLIRALRQNRLTAAAHRRQDAETS